MAESVEKRSVRRLEAARGYLALGMPTHALRELAVIDPVAVDRLPVDLLRGDCLRESGRHAEAVQAYRRALANTPRDVAVYIGLGCCYKRLDQLPKAITAMEEAYRIAPREPVVLYNMACYYALQGDKNLALSWLGRALRIEASLRKLIPDEHDFDQLRHDPDFRFVAGIRDVRETL